MNMLHIGRNILSLIFSRVLAAAGLFLIYSRLAQYLGPEAAGQYGVLAVYLTVFNFFVDLGMSQMIIKKMSEDRTHEGKYLSNYFFVQLGLGTAFMLIMDGIVFFTEYPQLVKNALYIAGFGLLLSSMSLPFRSVINAHQRLTIIAKVNFFNSVINGTFMVLAITLGKGVFFLSFISVAVSIFDIIVYLYIVNRHFTRFRLEIDWKFVRQLFVWTVPFMFLTLFSVYNRVDTLLLSYLRDFKEVGYYSVAYKFWDFLAFVPGVIGISLYPFFATTISQGNMGEVKKGLETYTRYMAALAVPLAVGAILLAGKITVTFFGADFEPAAPALALLVCAVAVLILYAPVNSIIISQQTKSATKITGFNLIFNITANIILISKFGFVAAAAVTVASETIQLLGYTYVTKKKIVSFKFFRALIKPAVASFVMAGVLYLLRDQSIWLNVAGGGFAYATALILTHFFQKSDWELFSAAINIRKPLTADSTKDQ